ncbi:hypothetical protein ZOSMA_393G00180 [Zostera marina]|uniref:Apple domain-containing protein n=1 Tax=Zostera marina TaxID=29655 RepID=A0A0K9P498_ZOSMR|nr:hypothetical protein ZOSMA_393G00180 [Zostera marina]
MAIVRRGRCWSSWKRTTVFFICVNLIAALYVFRSLYSTYIILFSNPSFDQHGPIYTEEEMEMIEESFAIRKASEPVDLVRVNIKNDITRGEKRWKLSQQVEQEMIHEILHRLNQLDQNATNILHQETAEIWRDNKLRELKQMDRIGNPALSMAVCFILIGSFHSRQLSLVRQMFVCLLSESLENALEWDWGRLREDLGLWIPTSVELNTKNKEIEEDLEEDFIIAGPALAPECNVEIHTDYGGAAVRWGLTHHTKTAAECCKACLDQSKQAKAGEMKCNIWVYCPYVNGCFSPDRYVHRHQECWLKQDDTPKLSFKDRYSQSYRDNHPTAPSFVPWMSGVVG